MSVSCYITLFDGDEGFALWDEWSHQSKKYQDGDCETAWESFGVREGSEKLTVASLLMWVREGSAEYRALEEERKRIKATERAEREKLTDKGNALRLIRLNGIGIRHDYGRNKWLVWDGHRWAEDAGARVMQLAKATATTMYKEAI